ncbi:hypothetical protein DUNSADRAFT_7865 [Dunaliella salina]|uniref:Encoded protein n=1 Tax=Dunaliella salina TaxID=3046 RepID=A0ABQ7GKH5_DUNSA|nr:hypothetical protein DUNSADRAFT_7865 [Dunaliella salina]|eukprot:KAF5835105.1 hypothetical protein DUNSADRAFT_7865 [Dunaliella salina]
MHARPFMHQRGPSKTTLTHNLEEPRNYTCTAPHAPRCPKQHHNHRHSCDERRAAQEGAHAPLFIHLLAPRRITTTTGTLVINLEEPRSYTCTAPHAPRCSKQNHNHAPRCSKRNHSDHRHACGQPG